MNLVQLVDRLSIGHDRIPYLRGRLTELQRDLFEARAALHTLEHETAMAAAMAILEGKDVTNSPKIDAAAERIRGLQMAIDAIQFALEDAQLAADDQEPSPVA